MKQEDAIMLEEYYIESITLSSYDADDNTIELIPMNSIRSITYKNKVQRDMLGNVIEEGE